MQDLRRVFVVDAGGRVMGLPRPPGSLRPVAGRGGSAGGVSGSRPSQPGPAQQGVTTHERLRLLGMTFRTDATIDQVESGRRLQWRAYDRQKRLEGSRLVAPTGPGSCRFTEVVEGRLLGPSRVLEPLVAWLLQRQTTSDLGRLKHLLETSTVSGSTPEEPTI
jgi:hypothetical protein